MFGKLMSVSDELMDRYYLLLLGEARDPSGHPMDAKKSLAEKLTSRYHGEEAGPAARADWDTRFSKKDLAAAELPELPLADLPADLTVLSLTAHAFQGRLRSGKIQRRAEQTIHHHRLRPAQRRKAHRSQRHHFTRRRRRAEALEKARREVPLEALRTLWQLPESIKPRQPSPPVLRPNSYSLRCFFYNYQQDKDWFYRNEERRWIVLNDASSWHQITRRNGKVTHTKLFF